MDEAQEQGTPHEAAAPARAAPTEVDAGSLADPRQLGKAGSSADLAPPSPAARPPRSAQGPASRARGRPLRAPWDPWAALKRSPAYGLAGVVHLALLVGLSFWTVALSLRREALPVVVRIAPAKTVLPSQREDQLDARQAVERAIAEALAGAESEQPFAEAEGEVAGELTGQASAVLGLSGGEGGGLGRGGSGGESAGSRAAIHAGLDWLARHRTEQGVWRPLPAGHRDPSTIPPVGGQLGHTGLAVICFLAAGHEPDQPGPYQQLLREARAWLVVTCKDGSFPQPRYNGLSNLYEVAIGVLALAECLQREEVESVRRALGRGVAYLTKCRHPRYGWRYTPRQDTDTSVTGWVLLALQSAAHAEVEVPAENYAGVKRWLARVSDPDTGRTGYKERGKGDNLAMTATGLFLRILLGEDPRSTLNRRAARQVSRVRVRYRGGTLLRNPYEVYYAALAMYQCGGRAWRRFNPRIRDALVSAQAGGRGCWRGSWHPGSAWVDERTLATCFAILTLETYYRYLPQHGGASSPGERALEEALGASDQAREPGELLARTAAFGRAAALLGEEGADWDLRAEAQVGLARAHARSGDYAQAKAALDAGLRLVPRGEEGPEGAQDLSRRLRLLEALAELESQLGAAQALSAQESAPAEERAALAGGLRVGLTRVRFALARTPGLDEPTRQQVERSLANAEELASGLLLGGDRDQAIASGLARLEGLEPGPRLEPFERRLLALLVQRAHERFQAARAGSSFARYEEAARDRAALWRLDPLRRAEPHEQPRLRAALAQLDLSQVAALVALGQRDDALKRLADLPLRYPAQRSALVQGQALERALLLASPRRDAEQAQRLRELLLRARRLGEPLTAAERLTLAELDLEARRPELAERGLEALLADPRVPPPLQRAAELLLSRVYRGQGRADDAWRLLAGLPAAEQARLDVILERCQVLRARRRPRQALDEYVGVLRAIEHEDPSAWWEVAEETARCYLEAREIRAARDFMEGLRRKDRTFGGDPERRERMLALMRRADDARVR